MSEGNNSNSNNQGNNTSDNNQIDSINSEYSDVRDQLNRAAHQYDNQEEKSIVDEEKPDTGDDNEVNVEELAKGVKDGASLAKNATTGNVLGAAKDAVNLAKNKEVKKTIKIAIIQAIAPFLIVLLLAGAILGVFDAVVDAIQDVLSGILGAIVDFFTVDETDGSIDVSDEQIDAIINAIEELGVSTEDLKLLGDYDENATEEEKQEALRKYIRMFYEAQAVTETLNYYHLESTDTETYGAVYVYRANDGDTDGTDRSALTYVPYDEMVQMQQNGDTTALNHFSIDDSDNLVIAGTNQVIIETGSSLDSLTVQSNVITVNLRTINYKSAISQYTTKMNFLIYLTMISQNPEFVAAVVDLIKDSRIEITIMDNVSTYVSTETYDYTLNSKEEHAYYDEYTNQTYIYYTTSSSDQTEITRTTTISTNPSANITYVKTWFCEQTVSYDKTVEGPVETSNSTWSVADESEPSGAGTWKTNQTYNTVEESTTEKYSETSRSDVTFTLGQQGDGERYANGEISEPTFVGLMETEFRIPYSTREEAAGTNLISGAEMLFYLLQKDSELENMETIMRYALYLLSGKDFGVTELDGSIFGISDFTSVSSTGGSLLKEYIRYFEHSTAPPTNADGTKYIIEAGAAGEPVVGYGVDVTSHLDLFVTAGYSTSIGSEVDVEFVDSLENQLRESFYNQVKSMTSGLDLTEYQLHALTSRAYNCGVSGALSTLRGSPSMNFVNSYKAYWNQETDDQYEERNSNADFSHSLYTQYMSEPTTSNGTYLAGLATRRKSEWTLFQTGYYDVLDKWYADGGDILEAADQLHQAQITWTYSVGGDLYWNDIEMSINNPNRVTCCATYVSSVLYLAGCFTEAEMNSFNYNLSTALYSFLLSYGWQTVSSYSDLQAGDIVFMDTQGTGGINHVQIYAGNGTWYNAGSTSAIQRASPYYADASSGFLVALRQN